MSGRVLAEALSDGSTEEKTYETMTYGTGKSPRRHVLRCWRVGWTRYIDTGWLE